MLLAQSVSIVCGSQTLPFTEFMVRLQRVKAAALLEADFETDNFTFKSLHNTSHPEYLMELRPKASIFTQLWRILQRNTLTIESSALRDILREHYRTVCLDPRDHIYSILSLIEAASQFQVNYEESVIDLFWRAGEYFNSWDLDSRISSLAKALSLKTSQMRIGIMSSHHKTISLRFERVAVISEAQYNGEPRKLRCSTATQSYCHVKLRTPGDIILCPQCRYVEQYDHGHRAHVVLSPVKDVARNSYTVTFFKEDCDQFELDNELWQQSGDRAALVKTWSSIKSSQEGSSSVWIVKVPKMYAVDCIDRPREFWKKKGLGRYAM